MKYTIKDIAKRANVSITTVSLVMNNKPHRISAETVKKINDVIEELNYKPNRLAQSMITNKTKTIGLIVPDITNPFFSEVSKQIEKLLHQHQYNLFLCNSYHEFSREKEYIEVLKDRHVDGIIISSLTTIPKKQYDEMSEIGIPFVFLDRSLGLDSKNVISIDDEKGGYLATEHLIKKGHRHIACIMSNTPIQNIGKRLAGYKKALQDYGIVYKDEWMIPTELTIEGGMEASKKLFLQEDITAVFCCNDLMAVGIYEAADKEGIQIPEDLSVVGFDNIPFSQYMKPKLTTINQPVEAIGEYTVECMMDLIQQKKKFFKSLRLDVSIMERNSVKEIK